MTSVSGDNHHKPILFVDVDGVISLFGFAPTERELPGVWTVLGGLLVPVAAWDRHDPDGWPERIRATTAFAMGMVTELEEHGADLGPGHRVHLDDAVVTATAGIPLGTTSPTAQAGLSPGR